ncbi:MAG: AAA family ATPase [Endozoicomonas sp.]|uniref:AAA family ATPase n=1 Tax=Endozoicomonas sp. TaxID=1892382 RepID=UPI003D9AF29C
MSVVCLEGASGIGKTTAAQFMEKEFGYVRIPEVNELFERPIEESSTWYFQKQVERWQLAEAASNAGKVAILDGDHLQTFWYNWIYAEHGYQPVSKVLDFFKAEFQSGRVSFPDTYIILSLPEHELRKRKEQDTTCKRCNFELHLQLIEPQRAYFENLSRLSPEMVIFQESISPESIAVVAKEAVHSRSGVEYDSAKTMSDIEKFLSQKPENLCTGKQ